MFLRAILTLLVVLFLPYSSFASMERYCSVPPFAYVSVPPNVLIILDNSASMYRFAYLKDYDPEKRYYGYFDPDKRYTYVYRFSWQDGYFVEAEDGEWSGNFLNWLTMRRIDVAKKVLVGGWFEKQGDGYMIYFTPYPDRDLRKEHDGVLYKFHPKSHPGDIYYFSVVDRNAYALCISDFKDCIDACYDNFNYCKSTCGKGDESCFSECKNDLEGCLSKCSNKFESCVEESLSNTSFFLNPGCWANFAQSFIGCMGYEFGSDSFFACLESYLAECSSKKYRLRLKVFHKPEGIVQKTWDKIRYGLMVFNHGNGYECNSSKWRDGGRIVSFISGPGENEDLVRAIQEVNPDTWTPLAEALYEAVRYFKAERSAYNHLSYLGHDPIKYRCQKNFVLLVTDGESTMDTNIPGGSWGSTVSDSEFEEEFERLMKEISEDAGKDMYSKYANGDCHKCKNGCGHCKKYCGTYYLEGVAYYAHTSDLREDLDGLQNLTLYTVYAFGKARLGVELLQGAAKYGGFDDLNSNNRPDQQAEWDKDGDGIPDNYYQAEDGYKLEKSIGKVIEDILTRASGTSVSILSERKKSGAILHQSIFYHKKFFGTHSLSWVGYLYTWWFLNTKKAQNIREDTNQDKVLEITEDRILEWYLDQNTGDLTIKVYSSEPTGEKGTILSSYSSFDDTAPVWEAGETLAYTLANERRIYTTDGKELVLFNKENKKRFEKYLNLDWDAPSCLGGSADSLIAFVRGEYVDGCRDRRIDNDGNVWKLGDIIYSSPVVVNYDNYSIVVVGANDGMLHAFKVGYLKKLASKSSPFRLQDSQTESTTNTIGEELWAFIPMNALPYLKYLADPNYCHLYFVDLKPFVYKVDEDGDGNYDKVILIGGMRLGGGVDCSNCRDKDCVPIPDESSKVGYSSYFALDITDPEKPKFMWEFTNKDLGFAYTGPGIVKKKDKYYVVFANGPTSYDGKSCKNLKFFVLDLSSGKLVKTIDRFINYTPSLGKGKKGKGRGGGGNVIRNAFGGRIFKEGFDYDGDGNTDYLFVGYTQKTGNSYGWNSHSKWSFKGGLIVLDLRSDNPENWIGMRIKKLKVVGFSKKKTLQLNPITAKVVVGGCFGRPYLYFGTGRWFYKFEDSRNNNKLFALPLKCDKDGCTVITDVVNVSDSQRSDDVCTDLNSGRLVGWYVNLSGDEGNYLKERLTTDPSTTEFDAVFFTTIAPTSDVCGFGGRSRVWLLNCATGGAVSQECKNFKVSKLKGTYLLQLSGADIRQLAVSWTGNQGESNLSSVFEKRGNRATDWFVGIAPESAPPFVEPGSGLVGRLLLWLER